MTVSRCLEEQTLILAFCSSLNVWYLDISTNLLIPVAQLPGTRFMMVMEPPPRLEFILAGRINSVEKNLWRIKVLTKVWICHSSDNRVV